jgi:ATP-dependent DNA helicase 2 subunit 2
MIVRFVKIKNAAPHLGVLMPHIKNEYEYLIYQKLPFAEDIRQYPFAPLDPAQIRTAYAPSPAQLDVAERLINALDLTAASKDEDGYV